MNSVFMGMPLNVTMENIAVIAMTIVTQLLTIGHLSIIEILSSRYEKMARSSCLTDTLCFGLKDSISLNRSISKLLTFENHLLVKYRVYQGVTILHSNTIDDKFVFYSQDEV